MKLGTYRHYSGKRYLAIALAKHSETHEDMVVYLSLYENDLSQVWVRPKKLFVGKVEVNGKKVPRFEWLKNS